MAIAGTGLQGGAQLPIVGGVQVQLELGSAGAKSSLLLLLKILFDQNSGTANIYILSLAGCLHPMTARLSGGIGFLQVCTAQNIDLYRKRLPTLL